MIFSINQTLQRILASIVQGGGGWSSTPPKFALDIKNPLRSLQRPPVGGTDPVGNHGSRQSAHRGGEAVSLTRRQRCTPNKYLVFVSGTHFC
jgi:hypothetical protein